MRAEIVTDDLERHIYRLAGAQSATPAAKRRGLTMSIIAVERLAKRRARSGGVFTTRSTGNLARKIGHKVEGDSSAVITSGVVYGRIHEFGGVTKPHDIPLRNARAFAFASGAGGFSNAARIGGGKKFHSVTSARVGSAFAAGKSITGMTVVSGSRGTPGVIKHPGSRIRAKHYTRDSFEEARPDIEEAARAMMAEIVKI